MKYTVIILSILANVLASIQKIISNKSFQTNGLFNIIWRMTTNVQLHATANTGLEVFDIRCWKQFFTDFAPY